MHSNKDEIKVGSRVEISPHYELWTQGIRYGVVVKIDETKHQAKVILDKSPAYNRIFPLSHLTVVT